MKKDSKIEIISYIFVGIFVLLCIIPFLVVISISLSSEDSILKFGYSIIPKVFSADAYRVLFKNPGTILQSYKITIFITVVGTVLSLFIGSMFAYAISRRDFKLSSCLSFFIYFTMLFSGGLVPTYMLISKYLNLSNTVWAIILPLCIGQWNIFLLKSFFKSVPFEIIEAAKIDGASEYSAFFRVVLPIARSGVATVGVFVVLTYWNDWYNAMLYLTNPSLYTLQYLLQCIMQRLDFLQTASRSGMVITDTAPSESLRMATCVVAAGPMIFVFLIFQRYFVKGITVGAVKG